MANMDAEKGLGGLQISSESHDYPAKIQHATGDVDGVSTVVIIHSFSDKIMVTISQSGRLAHWLQVSPQPSLSASTNCNLPTSSSSGSEDDLYPMTQLTPVTLLGGSSSERETMAQLYATQVASMIFTKNADETRTVLFGFGFDSATPRQEGFFDLMELVAKCV